MIQGLVMLKISRMTDYGTIILSQLNSEKVTSAEDISYNVTKYDSKCKVEITSMWGNIQPPGASLHKHSHHNSVFSGKLDNSRCK